MTAALSLNYFPPFQVFLDLSKEQELEDFDEDQVDLSVKWKLLPHEEP